MATIRKHRERWQVQVRRKGLSPFSKSFAKKSDADEWARYMEGQADRRALPADAKALDKITFGELIHRYIREVLPNKRAGHIEEGLLQTILKRCPDMISLPLSGITPAHFTRYREERLKTVKPSTVCRELGLIQHAYDVAAREWDVPITINPVKKISKPKIDNRRERRLSDDEVKALADGLELCLNDYIKPLVFFAIETGMRRGEMLNACWRELDREKKTLYIPQTKNGQPRTIPLSKRALEILQGLEGSDRKRIFPLSIDSVKMAWQRLIKRSKINDLHFHDLRHEAITRFFEKGLSVPEVALISGHKDFRMLFRYTHLRPESLVEKLG